MKNKITAIKRLAIGAVAGLASIASTANMLPAAEPSIGVRTRAENTSSEDALGNRSNWFKTTLGFTDCSSKESEAAGEFLRIYDNQVKQGEAHLHWISAGALVPYNVAGVKSTTAVYGSIGDKQGIGVESKHSFKDLSFVLNAEKAFNPTEAERLGIGVDYKVNSWLNLGAGFDQIRTEKGTTQNFLVNSELRLSEKDVAELAYRLSDNEGSKTNSVVAAYGHYGPNEKVGTRTHVRADWNPDTDFKSVGFQTIIAQNPTFGLGSYQWLRGRSNGDMFDSSVVDQSITNAERFPLNYRSKEGIVGQVIGNYTDRAGVKSSLIRGDLGYTFRKMDIGSLSFKPGVLIFGQHTTCDGKPSVNTYGASGIVDMGKILGGNLNFEVTGQKSSNGASEIYSGISLNWKF